MRFHVLIALLITTPLRLASQEGADRPAPLTATPLPYASGAKPVEAGGAGAYAEAGRLIILDGRLPGGPPVSLVATRLTASGWSELTPVLPGFASWHAGAQVSPDGSRLYFESNRREPSDTTRNDSDIWIADRGPDGWSNPRPLGSPFDSPHQEHNVTVSARGTICFNSSRPTTLGHDLLCATRTGSGWEDPQVLPSAVNSPAREIAPFIDAEERFLLFASNRAGGAGSYDLYISNKRNGEWQPAIPLDPAVNSAAGESSPTVSPDGKRLLFSREENGAVTLHEIAFDRRWLDPAGR